MLQGKTVLLGVTGSIAAYKIAYLASALKKLHAQVHVLMTENATNFINPITFESLTGNKCLVDTFDRNFQFQVEHVSIAKQADVVMIAPASANVIGKLAHGIADDMLTTTIMACKCKKRIFSPLKNKCPKPEFISFGTACHDVFFCQAISLCLPVTSPDATVKTIIFAVVCKLDQSTYINFISIHLLPYLICKISRILLIFL